jgi:hypothetical protein
MRVYRHALILVSLSGATAWLGAQQPPASPPAQAQALQNPERAAQILAEARKALGGDKISTVKTFVATGQTRRLSGQNLVPVEFEIDVELPDKYVRKDEIPAQESEPSSSGFNGDGLIQIPPPAAPPPAPAGPAAGAAAGGQPGRPGAPAMTPQQQQEAARRTRVTTIKQDFARLTIGMFATSFDGYPLTFGYAGQAEAPQGKADVIDVRGAGNFAARLFIAGDTHLPIMVSWTAPVTPANLVVVPQGQARPATLPPGAIVVETPAPLPSSASKEDQDKYQKDVAALRQKAIQGAKPIENRLYYADYRDNDGLRFPFKLRRAIGPDTIEETTFDRFRLNAKIDPRKFEVVK